MAASDSNLTDFQQLVRQLSERLVEAQRQIRILDATKWDGAVEEAFFKAGCRELPEVGPDFYEGRPLPFDPRSKEAEFLTLERDIRKHLGQFSPAGNIMRRMCREYRSVVRMLEYRGTADFSRLSQELYGSSGDVFHAGDPSLADFGELLGRILPPWQAPGADETVGGEEAVKFLGERLGDYFKEAERTVRVVLSDGIVADAAAGAERLKLRRDAVFTHRDLRLLEIHEGWVHLGTTLNGLAQPVCTFLSKGPPSSTITQEGLAILMEIFTFTAHPGRVRKIANRIRATAMAEDGADFLQVFRFYRDQGFSPQQGYQNAVRVFRGSTPTGGPFTKDLAYAKGFVLIYNYLLLAVRRGLSQRLPLLFCGKTTLEDMRTLEQLVSEGLVIPPKFLPPPFADLSAVTAWMCYSNFLALNVERMAADYTDIL